MASLSVHAALRAVLLLAVLPLAAQASFAAIPLLRLAQDVMGLAPRPSAPTSFRTKSQYLAKPQQQTMPASLRQASGEDSPWFCHGIDCPLFEVDTTFTSLDGVERRTYVDGGKWASVSVKGVSYDKAVYTGFMTLFDYISGANDEKTKIPMTAPVRVRLIPAAGPTCENEFIVSFFVPFDFQESTPAPTDESVFIEEQEPFTVYVASYGGFSSQDKVVTHASDLAGALSDLAIDIESDFYFSASYDPPFRLFKRHNEVWIMEATPSDYETSRDEPVFSAQQVSAFDQGVDDLRESIEYYSYSQTQQFAELLPGQEGVYWDVSNYAEDSELDEEEYYLADEKFSNAYFTEEMAEQQRMVVEETDDIAEGDLWSEPTYWDRVFRVFENQATDVWADVEDDSDDIGADDEEQEEDVEVFGDNTWDIWAEYDCEDCDDNEDDEEEEIEVYGEEDEMDLMGFADGEDSNSFNVWAAMYDDDAEEESTGVGCREAKMDEEEEDDNEYEYDVEEDEDESAEDEDELQDEDDDVTLFETLYGIEGPDMEGPDPLTAIFGNPDMASLMRPGTEIITRRTDVFMVVEYTHAGEEDDDRPTDVSDLVNRVMDMLNL